MSDSPHVPTVPRIRIEYHDVVAAGGRRKRHCYHIARRC